MSEEANKHSIRRKRLRDRSDAGILEYLRLLANELGKDTLTRHDLNKDGEISSATIHRRFGGLSNALIKAGLKPGRIYKRDAQRMISELAGLMRSMEREPRKSEIDEHLSYNARHYEQEFGGLKEAFDLAEGTLRENDVSTHGPAVNRLTKTESKRRYGRHIHFRGLGYAPINELGVVFVFGMLGEDLGFEIDSIQTTFPDCEARKKNRDGTWERVTIELEFRSSEFERHGHDPRGCDYLVCWEHDWKGCPDSLAVIELSEEIEEIKKRTYSEGQKH